MQHPAFPPLEELLAHAPFVRAVATAAVYGDADADDVVQATWMAAIERPPGHGRSVKGWLATVARNAARGLGRGGDRRRRREHRAARAEGVPSPAEIAEREETRRRLLDAVLTLEPPYREAILLRYYEDLPPREVAARLGVPVETARTRIKRGIHQLRASLDGAWDGDRRAWALAIAPLAAAGAGAGAAASLAGAGLLAKAALVLLAVGVLGGGAWYAIGRDDREAADAQPDVELASADEADDVVPGARLRPAPEGAPRSPKGRGRIRGEVLLDPGVTGATVEVALQTTFASLVDLDLGARFDGLLQAGGFPQVGNATTTEPDGRFVLEGLAAGVHLVRATAPDGRARVRPALLSHDGATGEVRLDLTRGPHTLQGRVRTPTGAPAHGRVLLIASQRSSWGLTLPAGPAPVALDDEGRFAFPHLHPGRYDLAVVVPGRRCYRRGNLTVPGTASLDITLGATTKLTGRVVDAQTGAGIAGARVRYYVEETAEGASVLSAVDADAVGRFVADDLGPKMSYLASAPGYPLRRLHRPSDGEVILRLDRAATVMGLVTGSEGTPVEGVLVRAAPWTTRGDRLNAAQEARTNAAGRYEIPGLPPGEVMVLAWGDGWMSPGLEDIRGTEFNPFVHAAEPGEVIQADLEVVRAARVEGRVLDAEGRAVPGAAVNIQGGPTQTLMGPRGLPLGFAGQASDEEGRFVLETVPPGDGLAVRALTSDGTEATSKPFEGIAGETHTVDVVLPATRVVEVRVVDEEGQPVSDAPVYLVVERDGRRSRRPAAGPGGLATTNADGILELRAVPEGEVAVAVQAPGYVRAESAAIDADATSVRVVLDRTMAIAGRLEADAELPWKGVRVWAKKPNGGTRTSHRADREGAFRIDGLPPGRYQLEASLSHDGTTWSGRVEAEAGAMAISLVLQRPAEIEYDTPARPAWEITVLDGDGNRVPHLSQRRYGRWQGQAPHYQGYGSGRSNPVRVEAAHTHADDVWIEIFGAADADGRPLPLGARLLTPRDLPEGGGALEIRLAPEKDVAGKVLDAAGAGLAGATVQAFPIYDAEKLPRVTHDPHAETRTRQDGSFRLAQLGDHAYELRVRLPENFVPPPPLRVKAGEEGAEIRVRAAAVARLRVVDPDGRPCAGCSVRVEGERDPRVHGRGSIVTQGRTDADGRVTLGGLEPTIRYLLVVDAPSGAEHALGRTVERWEPADGEIELPAAHLVAGLVVDPAGHPVPHAWVNLLTDPPNGWTTYRANAEGGFRIARLRAGEAVLKAHPRGHIRGFSQPDQRVHAGDTDLRLVVDPGGQLMLRLSGFEGDPTNLHSVRVTDVEDGARHSVHCGFDAEGVLVLSGLHPDHRYAIDVRHENQGFFQSGLRAGDDPVSVVLASHREVVVRLDLPGGLPDGWAWARASVAAEGEGWTRHGRLLDAETGRFVIPALPPGSFQVRAHLGREWAGTTSVESATDGVVVRLLQSSGR